MGGPVGWLVRRFDVDVDTRQKVLGGGGQRVFASLVWSFVRYSFEQTVVECVAVYNLILSFGPV